MNTAMKPARCGICAAKLPIGESGRRLILASCVECARCGAPTVAELDGSRGWQAEIPSVDGAEAKFQSPDRSVEDGGPVNV
jgi:hypothetical protein